MTVVSIFTCYTTGSGELMDSAAEGVSGALASCIRLLFAISLSVPCLLEYLPACPTCW